MSLRPIKNIEQYQKICRQKLDPKAFDYFSSGSDDEITLRNNIEGFKNIFLAPRVLISMGNFTMKTKIMGKQVSAPFGFAPVAMQRLIDKNNGELLSSSEAFKQNTAYGLSMLTTSKVSQVAKVNPSGVKILQLYFMKNADYTKKVIKLAEDNGFTALAITVDTQIFGKRRRDERNKFSPVVILQLFKELGYDFKFRDDQNKERSFVHQLKNDLTWQDIAWMRQNTKLKIILKGIMSVEDVSLAHQSGVDAIWISNHGGRQLDTSPATIWALSAIKQKAKSLNSKMQIYIDGGIRSGQDIFKALALGADFVFLGRGFLYSLIEGEKGVHNAFQILKSQLTTVMMLAGTPSIADINSDYILRLPNSKL